MAESISRRALTKALVAGTATTVLSRVSTAQGAKPPADDYARLQTLLAKPLPQSMEKTAREALAQTFEVTKQRQRFKLDDCSEPCFVFVPRDGKRK